MISFLAVTKEVQQHVSSVNEHISSSISIDFEKNTISFDNRSDHNTVNDDESNISNPAIRTDCDNIVFINNCDNKDSREKTGNLNVTFSFDKDNNLERVNDINATNSMNGNISDNTSSYNNSNHNMMDNDRSDNITFTNTTNISEYLPSTSETTVETEIVEYERNHNVSTNNDKNSSVSLIDISSVNTFGCREENLSIPFSQSKGLQKKNFCYYCKKLQSKIARHLENVHKLEPEVQKFILLPKGNHIFKFYRNV
jgi:hypothetical protein